MGVVAATVNEEEGGWTPAVLGAPLAAGLAVYGTGRVLGHDGRLAPTLLGAGVGAASGLALLYAGRALNSDDGFAVGLLGAVAYVLLPPATALVGFDRSRPAVRYVRAAPGEGAWVTTLAVRL